MFFTHQSENVNKTIYNCDIKVYFNQECLLQKLIPDFAKMKYEVVYDGVTGKYIFVCLFVCFKTLSDI